MGEAGQGVGGVRAGAGHPATLGRRQPDVPDFQSDLAASHAAIGLLLGGTGKPAEALRPRAGAGHPAEAGDVYPTISDYRHLAHSLNNLGRMHARLQHFPEAFAALDAGLALRRKLADAHPTVTLYTRPLGYSYAFRGGAHALAGHPAEAAADLRQALALWEKEKAPDPELHLEQARRGPCSPGWARTRNPG